MLRVFLFTLPRKPSAHPCRDGRRRPDPLWKSHPRSSSTLVTVAPAMAQAVMTKATTTQVMMGAKKVLTVTLKKCMLKFMTDKINLG